MKATSSHRPNPWGIFPAAAQTTGLSQDGKISRSFLGGGLGEAFFAKKGSPDIAHTQGGSIQ
ncbi:hypothetical protein FAK_34740 [Desulfoferula mesophila]|uniref:Uncharacterized protein n=1 Tax=Desulfoferula mesophila TaxID=3058419 RepID=A0AAU9F273_9BACT|nr:hypothetical protein FAK_34740 [Desulfoferula mesophilus]